MTTFRRDIISSVILGIGAVTLYTYVSTFPVRANQPAAVSAGFYPVILALALGVLAVVQLVTAIVKEKKARTPAASNLVASDGPSTDPAEPPPSPEKTRIWKDAASFKLFMLTVAALIVYPFMMRLVGFSITGLAFLGTLIFALSRDQRRGKNAWIIAAITLGIGVLTFVVFRHFLNIPFPRGILFER